MICISRNYQFVKESYLYKMNLKTTILPVLWTFLTLIFLSIPTNSSAQRSIGLDKGGKVKRIHFYEGQSIRIKLLDKEKVAGHIDAIYDSSFVIEGRKILLSEVEMVYSVRPPLRFLGGAFMVAGVFYFSIDAVNNLFNYAARGYVFSDAVWLPSAVAVGAGAIMYYFSIRRTKVNGQGNFKIYNTNPIPISTDQPEPSDLKTD